MDKILSEVYEGVIEGNVNAVVSGVEMALSEGADPGKVLNEGLISAMSEVGRLFEAGEYYVPEMLISARAMKAGLAKLRPLLVQSGVRPLAKIAIGTVKGDLHDIGKNLVGMMLEGAAFEVIDLGSDVSPDKFVEAVKQQDVQILAMSALLTTTMVNIKTTIDAIETAGLRSKIKIIIGGAPVTDSYARQIRADGYASDASRAVTLAKTLIEK
jgi:5-methyltetrahydrofolate--homocysteine methyltransferase